MKLSLTIFIFFFFFSCNNGILYSKKNNIALQVDSVLAKSIFNGVILITKGEETVYAKAIGFADLDSKKNLSL